MPAYFSAFQKEAFTLFLILISLLFLSACNPTSPISKAAGASSAGSMAWETDIDGQAVLGISAANGVVYTGGRRLHAFDEASGRQKWESNLDSGFLFPVVADGMVYACGFGVNLFAFDATSGQPKWNSANCPREPVVVADGIIYAEKERYDAATGLQKFASKKFPDPGAAAHHLVYMSCTTNRLCAYDAVSEQQKWSVRVGTVSNSVTMDSFPVAADGVVCVFDINSGTLYAFDAVSGKRKWVASADAKNFASVVPVIANGVVYISGTKLYAFDAVSGQQKWALTMSSFTSPTDARATADLTTPAIADGVVYVVSSWNRQLFALDAASGRQKWAAAAGSFLPFIADDKVYVTGYASDTDKTTLRAFYR